MDIPKELIPILEKITQNKNVGIEFWNDLEGEDLDELFFSLAAELVLSDLDEDSIPLGYKLAAYIYHWESNCLFSGWYAIENCGDMLPTVTECYKQVGLTQEALAIKKASEAWVSEEQDHDKVGAAYSSVDNPYKDQDVRFNYLSKHLKNNSKSLFYASK